MAKLNSFKGSVNLISGLIPKNNGDFPLMQAHDIVVDEQGKRLDDKLEGIVEEVLKALPYAEEVSV